MRSTKEYSFIIDSLHWIVFSTLSSTAHPSSSTFHHRHCALHLFPSSALSQLTTTCCLPSKLISSFYVTVVLCLQFNA
ncbi:hypothetical protein MTR_8g073150 [Medicago truncatula]|uniref:Uncharacterized protein n=1 Tax=Medicago truncatula TaxID=3880 RepID=G7L8P2_MEDTR|nr:hypothetical protein MTR_8g073150 [Medicago truncatula]